ncbi:MAG: hypothetical protein LBU38_01175, partial [Propionibacteriaceae bacterium]|nr:hypothetical protein [Propionibacteriaceae bacterium]
KTKMNPHNRRFTSFLCPEALFTLVSRVFVDAFLWLVVLGRVEVSSARISPALTFPAPRHGEENLSRTRVEPNGWRSDMEP